MTGLRQGFGASPKDHFTAAELAGVSAMPTTERGVRLLAERAAWSRRKRAGRGGGWEYPLSCLPVATRAALIVKHAPGEPLAAPANENSERSHFWAVFDHKPQKLKDIAGRRLRLINSVEALQGQGWTKLKAIAAVANESGLSVGAIRTWFALIEGADRGDRLPALAPRWSGRTATATCSIEAWDFFKADYLRQARPAAQACYERLQRAAAEHGWSVPSLKTLLRRLESELHPDAVVAARYGSEALKRSYPAQERDRSMFAALEAVNADGHRFDVFVRWEDGEVSRPVACGWQDIYSGKFLSWRIGKVESAELVRLAFADLVERWGVPAHAWMDNGRGFAAKWITGGVKTRYRFKVKEEEPLGVLPQLGVQVHWTQPYSGQSKPIERGFRDWCEYISRHPRCQGAYCGNRPDARPEDCGSKPIPIADFIALVETEVAAHNARQGRRSPVCAGRSFDDVFNASYAQTQIRKASEEQRRLLLLAAEAVGSNRDDGSVRLLGNRYWSDAAALARAAGDKLVVRFDPQHLDRPVHVYSLDGRFIATCPCVERAGFGDVEAGKAHARARNQRNRAIKEQLAAERRMSALEVAAMLPASAPSELRRGEAEAKIVRPLFGSPSAPKPTEEISQAEADARLHEWTQAMRKKQGIER